MSRFLAWIGEWVETLHIAPPFSKRRRNLLAALKEAQDSEATDWVEVRRP